MRAPEQFDNKLLILFCCFKAKLLVSTVANRINILVYSFKELAAIAETCSTEMNLSHHIMKHRKLFLCYLVLSRRLNPGAKKSIEINNAILNL